MPPVSLDHLLKLAMTFPCPNYVQPELQNMTSFVNSVFTEVKVEHLKMTSFWIYENDLWCLYEGMEREICTHEEGDHVKMDSDFAFGRTLLPSKPRATRGQQGLGETRGILLQRCRGESVQLTPDFRLPSSRTSTL